MFNEMALKCEWKNAEKATHNKQRYQTILTIIPKSVKCPFLSTLQTYSYIVQNSLKPL
jgi:hypothetical protein